MRCWMVLTGCSIEEEHDRREQQADRETDGGRRAGVSERERSNLTAEIVRENDEEYAG